MANEEEMRASGLGMTVGDVLRHKEGQVTEKKVWAGDPGKCNFCDDPLKGQPFVDGKTRMSGSWGMMCMTCFEEYGVGLGPGKGQMYDKNGVQVAGGATTGGGGGEPGTRKDVAATRKAAGVRTYVQGSKDDPKSGKWRGR
jgi:hypothetical protein